MNAKEPLPVSRVHAVIVDDQNLVRAGLRAVLTGAGVTIVGEASCGEDALVLIRELYAGPPERHPNVVVMEQKIPGLGGVESTKRIKDAWPGLDVVLLTRNPDEAGLRAASLAGASGYVSKDAPPTELIDATRAAADGGRHLHPVPGGRSAHLDRSTRPDSMNVSLSEREIDVLRLVVKGYSSKEIASTLFLSIRTVESHRASIIKKTGIRARSELTRFARDAGILRD